MTEFFSEPISQPSTPSSGQSSSQSNQSTGQSAGQSSSQSSHPSSQSSQSSSGGHQLASSRTINAPASAIFSLLSDPTRHPETEPGDWVRSARTHEPITGVGQVFGMNMFHPTSGDYVMANVVSVYEPDQAIAWDPGQPDEEGNPKVGGWRWRYDLHPSGNGTDVTLTYDWSGVSPQLEQQISFPVFGPDFLGDSLAALERAVTSEDQQHQ